MSPSASASESPGTTLPPHPYPGLRAFEKSEWPIFFGRERMTSEVIDRLIDQQLVVVHGSSGSGKSSLIRAGVLADLEQEHERSGLTWRTVTVRPSEGPIDGLAKALLATMELHTLSGEAQLAELHGILNLGRQAAPELAQLLRRNETDHVCILIDQFEELFRFAKERSYVEANLLTDILVGLEELTPDGLYFILTMRSEFLGACAQFEGFAEAVNRTQYLLPEMDRSALMRAICEPAALYNGGVDRKLATRLINDAGEQQDQLPLIQHGLMLLQRRKLASSQAAHSTDASPLHDFWWIELDDYTESGGLAALLSSHADEVMAEAVSDGLGEKTIEHIFRALTDINAEGHAIRRPQKLSELAEVTGASMDEVRDRLAPFRADGVSFIMPYGAKPLEEDTLIDISHEALIRCWQRIAGRNGWLVSEFQDGLTWQTLKLQDQELSAAATENYDRWLKTLPSPAWADRYGNDQEEVEDLMARSREARRRQVRKDNQVRYGAIAAAVIFFALAAISIYMWVRADQDRERALTAQAEAEEARNEAQDREARAVEAEQEAERQAAEAEAARTEAEAERAAAEEARSEAERQAAAAEEARAEAEAQRNQANAARSEAEAARIEAERVQNEGWRRDSLFRMSQSVERRTNDLPVAAIQLALEGLPSELTPPDRPWFSEPAGALVEALGARRERLVLRGHTGDVLSTAFSPDGSLVASGAEDNAVRIWDVTSDRKVRMLCCHEDVVWGIGFSPDGTRLVSGSSDSTVKVWDLRSGRELMTLSGHTAGVDTAIYSPDGRRILSSSEDSTMRIWDALTGRELNVLSGHTEAVIGAAFSADSRRIVSGSRDRTVRIWDAETGQELQVMYGHEGDVYGVSFSPDGTRIASGAWDNTVRIWDPATGQEVRTLLGHENVVYTAQYSSDGLRILSSSWDHTLRLWDAVRGEALFTYRGHDTGVIGAALSADGRYIASGSDDSTVRIWDVESNEELTVLSGHRDAIQSVAFSPDGTRAVSGAEDDTVRVWDTRTGEELAVLVGHTDDVFSATFSPDGQQILSGAWDNTLRLWDAETGALQNVLYGHENVIYTAIFSPDGSRIASSSWDSSIRIWDARSGALLNTLWGHESGVHTIAFSADGRRLASGSDDSTVRVWDVSSGLELRVLRGHEMPVWGVAFTPDGRKIVSSSQDTTVRIWDAQSGANLMVLDGHQGAVWATAVSPDGRRIVSGSEDATVRIWDIESGEERIVLRGHEKNVISVTFSPDGSRIASGSEDNSVRITWIGRSEQELLDRARDVLPRELTDEERQLYHLSEQ